MCDDCNKGFEKFLKEAEFGKVVEPSEANSFGCDLCSADSDECLDYDPESFGGDEYAPEENPFDRFDDDWYDDEDCDCDLCKMIDDATQKSAEDLEGDMLVGAVHPDDLEPSPFVEGELDGEGAVVEDEQVVVFSTPGEDFYPYVLKFTTDTEKEGAFSIIFDEIVTSVGFDYDLLPSSVRGIALRAEATRDAQDIRDAVNALAYKYPFYVVFPA